jgi:hypothetical protein
MNICNHLEKQLENTLWISVLLSALCVLNSHPQFQIPSPMAPPHSANLSFNSPTNLKS